MYAKEFLEQFIEDKEIPTVNYEGDILIGKETVEELLETYKEYVLEQKRLSQQPNIIKVANSKK